MQKKLKIVFVLIGLIFSHLYVGYIESKKVNNENFINEIGYNLILLNALNDDKIKTVKMLLSNDINRVFLRVGENNNAKLYAKSCKYINTKNIKLLEKYDIDIDEKNSKVYPEAREIHKNIILGRKKMIGYCKNNKIN